MGLASGDHKVVRLVLLQHKPHGRDVFYCVTPIALCVQISQVQFIREPRLYLGHRTTNLSSDKGLAAARRFVVKKDAVAGKDAVTFSVVDRKPIGVELGRTVGTPWVKRRGFPLRRFLNLAKHFRTTRLVKSRF